VNRFRVSVDIGGTFTDAVAIDEKGNMWYSKVPTTQKDRTTGVMNSHRAVAGTIGISTSELPSQTAKFAHDTTATVNAMIQLSGVKIGLITTKGFKDHPILMKACMYNDYVTTKIHRGYRLPAGNEKDGPAVSVPGNNNSVPPRSVS